jgi:hypothetical protein
MSDIGRVLAEVADDTPLELVVATVITISPLAINLNGVTVTNPPSLVFTPVANTAVMCIRHGPSIFVLGQIVNRS